MRLWIDATAVFGHEVFGIAPLERNLRAVLGCWPAYSSICVDGLGSSPTGVPEDLQRRLPLVFSNAPGTAGERLARFAAESPEPVVAVSADCIVDSRLFAVAADRPPGFAAIDRGGALLSFEPGTVNLDERSGSVMALAEFLVRAGSVRPLRQSEFPGFIRGLRRVLPFYLLPVRSIDERKAAERFMFRANYKGSTDLFTKYVYPLPVWLLLRPLTRLRVHPNWLSALNIVLAIAAVPAFAAGEYLLGFAFAYLMSVLDSVDGKLARLTFTDSRLGTLLDHGLDLIHPPFWYAAWAWAAAGGDYGHPAITAGALLVIVYVLDRLCLKVYSVNFRRGLHAHAPIDGLMRTFIARRNINLPLFTLGVVFGCELEAFLLIVVWQLATLIWHLFRVGWVLLFETSIRDMSAAA